jgi:hypothetical protein
MNRATGRPRTDRTPRSCAKAHLKRCCATMKTLCLKLSKRRTRPTSRCKTVQTRGRSFGGRSGRAGCQLTRAISSAEDTGIFAVSPGATDTAGGNGPDNEWIAQHWSLKSMRPWW